MKFVAAYSHHKGVDYWKGRDIYEWVTDIFEAPQIKIEPKGTVAIRNYIENELSKEGWAFNVTIDAESDLNVFSKKDDLVIQLQTGNISRYAYDLLKLQHLYSKKDISAALLAVPTKTAANIFGSNVANIDRIWNELNIFDRVITVPIMVIAFE